MSLPHFTSVRPCPAAVCSPLLLPRPLRAEDCVIDVRAELFKEEPKKKVLKRKNAFLFPYELRRKTFYDVNGHPNLHALVPVYHPFFLGYDYTQKHTPIEVSRLILNALADD